MHPRSGVKSGAPADGVSVSTCWKCVKGGQRTLVSSSASPLCRSARVVHACDSHAGDRRGAFTVNVRKVKLRRSVGLDEFAFFDISNLRHGAENEL